MKRIGWIVLLIAVMVFSGCAGTAQTEEPPAEALPETPDPVEEALTVTDSLGRTVSLDAEPQRIVSLAPAITEILFVLDLGDRIVGVTEYCDFPAEAAEKPKVGGFKDPNMERILEQQPDLIFVAYGVQEELVDQMEDLGLTVCVLDAETVPEVAGNIRIAGTLTGAVDAAERVAGDIETRMEAVIQAVSGRTAPTVFFEVWNDPLMTAGSTSFLHSLLTLAGGNNIGGDSTESYYNYSMELLLEKDPQVYIINDHSHTPDDVMARPGYDALQSVKAGRVYSIDDNLINRAGPRVIDGLEQMAQLLHPEAF